MAQKHWPQHLPPRRKLGEWLAEERRAYHGAAHVFTMTATAARSLVDDYGVPARNVSPVGGGLNFDGVPEVRHVHEAPSKTILFVGREWKRKGGDVLVSAFREVRSRVPDARLAIVGVQAREVGQHPGVEVLGDVSDRSVVLRLYADAAVFCLPSVYEPYGFALVEAMGLGLPCIAAEGVASHEIVVPEQTGLLVEPRDPHALAVALVRLLENPGEAIAMGQAGRRRVEEELNWRRVVDRMERGLHAAADEERQGRVL
jgi:glycosyltransferase involved in cell wall biosynthesis